jgi:Protein of unknown function (DUF2510)
MSFGFGFLVGDLVGSALERGKRARRRWYPDGLQPPAPPPGWYADPAGSPWWRWWDGRRWTAHVGPPHAGSASGFSDLSRSA